VLDIRQEERLPLGRDPTREAATERDPHPLPDRRPGYQLAALDIEQQDRGRIGAEDRADPVQELTEQLVEVEVGERRVGHRLHLLQSLPRTTLWLEQTRMLDCDGRPLSDQTQQLDLVLLEHTRDERADMQYAGRLALDKQRHPQKRLDPLLAEQRVQHVRTLDIRQEERLPLGRDPTREARTERDPHPLFDLLLDPDRRPCYQLAARDVQQQDRDRVDLEQRPRSFEQNRQQVVETQMRKRRIGDQLHTAQPLGVAQVGLAFQGVHDSLGRKPLLSQTVDVVLRADDAKCRSPLMGSAHEGTLTVDRDETS
jgi:hypothetical protein